jgi:hypothetical protein
MIEMSARFYSGSSYFSLPRVRVVRTPLPRPGVSYWRHPESYTYREYWERKRQGRYGMNRDAHWESYMRERDYSDYMEQERIAERDYDPVADMREEWSRALAG